MKRHIRLLGAALGLTALPLLAACSENSTGLDERVDPNPQFTVTPAVLTMETGQSWQLMAKLGIAVIPAESVEWISEDPERAQVSEDGVVTAMATGAVYVMAWYQDHSDRTRVRVRARLTGEESDEEPERKRQDPEQ